MSAKDEIEFLRRNADPLVRAGGQSVEVPLQMIASTLASERSRAASTILSIAKCSRAATEG
jgi:hypothetical protein